MENELVLFKDGEIEIDVQITPEKETVWLTQEQMSELFGNEKDFCYQESFVL